MEKLIPLINEIHEILFQTNLSNSLEMPQIVVIGAQSVGKTSVLESIIGQKFLPRGKGIVTRCPIEIQLSNISENQEKHVEFSHRKGEKFVNFQEITNEILNYTDKVCGYQKGISNIPIRIKYYSPDVVNLMLVDLPGITKNPVGDQPKDIEDKILDLIHPYVKNENSLIIAVSKGNDDLANSESLKLARQIDQKGERTIGVITQLDIMDEGSDVLNDLMNKTYPLKLGYVGVVCKGNNDLKNQMSIKEQIKYEKMFLETHRIYSKIQDKMGIPYLIKTLNYTFIQHIKRSLPRIRDNIIELIQIKEYDLKQYGEGQTFDDSHSKQIFMLNLINRFSNSFSELLRGKHLRQHNEELIGGARINYICFDIFKNAINEINPFDMITDEEIRVAIRNANGLRPSLFLPEIAFENLVRKQIMRLQNPSLECSHLIFEEIRRVLYTINIPEIDRFENLNKTLLKVMEGVLMKCKIPCDDMIKNLIAIELGYINTNHPDFVGGTNALLSLIENEEDNVANKDDNKHDQNKQKHILDAQINQKKNELGENKLVNNFKQGLQNFIPFLNSSKQAESMDNKLDMIYKKKQSKIDFISDQSVSNFDMKKKENIFQQNELAANYMIDSYLENIQPKHLLQQPPSNLRIQGKPSKREQIEIEMIKKIIVSYFNVVKKNINDSVPKTIITLLVNQSKNISERELISQLYKPEIVDELLEENSFIIQCREKAKKTIILLRNSLNIINNLDSKF